MTSIVKYVWEYKCAIWQNCTPKCFRANSSFCTSVDLDTLFVSLLCGAGSAVVLRNSAAALVS